MPALLDEGIARWVACSQYSLGSSRGWRCSSSGWPRPALVAAAFSTWLVPLLGIIFLPFATLIYVILYTPGFGLAPWEWFWVVLAGVFDLAHLVAGIARRRELMGRA
jgi:hypothetical protein